MVISLADGQLATGIALLVAAIKKLEADKDISIYHFNLVTKSVFLSSAAFTYAAISYRLRREWVAHTLDGKLLPMVRVSRKDGFEPGSTEKERLGLPWTLRIILVVALDALLLFSAWVSLKATWNGLPPECPASCFRHLKVEPTAKVTTGRSIWVISSFVISSVVNIVVCLQLAGVYTTLCLPKVRHGLNVSDTNAFVKKVATSVAKFWTMLRSPTSLYDLVFLGFVVWYSEDLHTEWRSKPKVMSTEDLWAEDSMGFGQLVPLFLLILFVLQVLESIRGMSVSS